MEEIVNSRGVTLVFLMLIPDLLVVYDFSEIINISGVFDYPLEKFR